MSTTNSTGAVAIDVSLRLLAESDLTVSLIVARGVVVEFEYVSDSRWDDGTDRRIQIRATNREQVLAEAKRQMVGTFGYIVCDDRTLLEGIALSAMDALASQWKAESAE